MFLVLLIPGRSIYLLFLFVFCRLLCVCFSRVHSGIYRESGQHGRKIDQQIERHRSAWICIGASNNPYNILLGIQTIQSLDWSGTLAHCHGLAHLARFGPTTESMAEKKKELKQNKIEKVAGREILYLFVLKHFGEYQFFSKTIA